MEANVDVVISKTNNNSNFQVKKKRESPAQCPICLKMFSRGSVLKLHLETHNKVRRYYECDVCSKKILGTNEFISHFRSHSHKPYTCDVCSKKFAKKNHLQRHNNTVHTNLRKFKCLVCLNTFKKKSVLKTHMKKHTRQPVTCKLCGRVFETQNWLNFHLKYTDHNKTRPLYSCDICSQTLRSKSSLKTHFLKHQTEKNVQ